MDEQQTGMPEEDFAKLMQGVSAFAPLLKGILAPPPPKPPETVPVGGDILKLPHPACARREALLIALKPYLSPGRCEAVDYLIRLSRVGDAIRAMR